MSTIVCYHTGGIPTAEGCRIMSSDPERNKECDKIDCPGLWRVCRACVASGAVDDTSRITNRNTGLCSFHIDNGEAAVKPRRHVASSISEAVVVPFYARGRFRRHQQKQKKEKAGQQTGRASMKNGGAGKRNVNVPAAIVTPQLSPVSSQDKTKVAAFGLDLKHIPKSLQGVLVSVMKSASAPFDVSPMYIRRFQEQPREHFSEAELQELAASLAVVQIVPVFLRKLVEAERAKASEVVYELIDGERRWRAAQLANLPTIRAVVLDIPNVEVQFAISAIANFGRAGHTPMEEARALKIMMDRLGVSIEDAARVFAHTREWAYTRLALLRLHPDIWKILDPSLPKEEQLAVSLANRLAGYVDQDFQLQTAREIVSRDMSYHRALLYIKKQAKALKVRSMRKEKGGSVDAMRRMRSFVNNTFPRLEAILEIKPEHVRVFSSAVREELIGNFGRIGAKTEKVIKMLTNTR